MLIDNETLIKWEFTAARLKRYLRSAKESLPLTCATDTRHLLIKNIINQTYSNVYPSYNTRYAAWKTEMVGHKNYWKLYGDTIKALQVFKFKKGRVAGIPAGLMGRGGKSWFGSPQRPRGAPKPISWYAYLVEKGFGKNPKPRPLFEYTAEDYYYGAKFKSRINETLNKVKTKWRMI